MNPTLSTTATLAEQRGVFHHTDWRAAATGGVTAGIVYIAALSLFSLLGDRPVSGPTHSIAAVVLRSGVLAPEDSFAPQVVAVAVAVHLGLSLLYGVLIGWLVHRMKAPAALAAGTAFALVAIFGVNFYLIAPAAFPWFVDARDGATALAHGLFGLIAAAVYVALRRPRPGPTRVWRQS